MTKITEIELVPVRAKEGLTFFANCILDGKYFVGSLAVFTLRDGSGFRIVYPTKVLRNGSQLPIFYPVDKGVSAAIQKAISNKATKLLEPDNSLGGDGHE